MTVPTLIELRDQLGRALVAHPNDPLLHNANRVLSLTLANRERLKPVVKLAVGRTVALALDSQKGKALTAGETSLFLSDRLDPRKQSTLGWCPTTFAGGTWYEDLMRDWSAKIDHAAQLMRNQDDDAVLAIANALDDAYQAVSESAKNVGQGALDAAQKVTTAAIVPVVLAGGLLLAWGYSRRRA